MKKGIGGKILAVVFFAILFFTVVFKAIYVPITHDEKASTLYYPNFTVWQIMMYTDNWPNNHILNTLFIKLEEHIWTIEPWVVRLHSVISFVLFYFMVYLIAVRYFAKSVVLFCLPFFIMFCNPYLLDFYGLARGYGLSNALMVCSIYALLRFAKTFKAGWYYLTIILAMLAAYANFTLLVYWVAVSVLLVSIQIIHSAKTGQSIKDNAIKLLITACIAIAFLALCYNPLYKMQSTNQFIYWASNSFFGDTIVNEATQFWYGAPENAIFSGGAFARQAVFIFMVAGSFSVYRIITNLRSAIEDPLVITFVLLLLFVTVNLSQTILLGTPYLTGRTALCYYILFAWVFIFLLRYISLHINWFTYSVVPLLIVFFSWHLYNTVDLYTVREWWYDKHTYDVQNYLNNYRQNHADIKTIDLNITWIFNPSFSFYTETGKTPWLNLSPYHKEVDTSSQTLFYYATYGDATQLKNYRVVKEYRDAGNILMMRR